MQKINLFISYAHEDEAYKDKLDKHLSLLKRNNIIEAWSDRKIVPGQEWDKKIKNEIKIAKIILLLISVDFLNSNYCYDVEIKRALERHEKKEAIVIPIILRKCDWQDTDFSKLQALPKNARPVKNFEDEDEAFFNIIEGIKSAITELNKFEDHGDKINSVSENDEINIIHKHKMDCDTPPNTPNWVGRQKEIAEIDLDLHRVVFISGIGGQGKSGLASHYIKEVGMKKSVWEYWDWRDCQEKENRIHTKIISIIERLTSGTIQAKNISDHVIDDLIELLFHTLGTRKILFVFDNIDAYIEFENFQLIGAVKKLYDFALKTNHNSKFIFTCRSSINDVDTELLTIKLQGLSKDDTFLLFTNYNLSLTSEDLITLVNRSFELTKGHPLWLNLIAAQARRGLEVANQFIKGISTNSTFQEESLSSILSNKILGAIWNSLNEKQKTLLMAFAEIVRAETEDNLSKILHSELNHNQFSKAFKTLKQLNLVVIKSMIDEQDTFELHPLVKEYVIQNFGRVERSKFISLFVNFYDGVILILKPKLNSNQPLSFFENWTAKIELAINKDDYKAALLSLEEISSAICDAGYVEEYIRVANLLYINIGWKTAINEELSYFNSQFSMFINTLTEFGKFDEAGAFLTKYEKHIVAKGTNYIRFCKAKGYFFWFQGKFEDAIEIATEGLALEGNSGTKSGIDLEHTLALALRDTKVKENVEKAFNLFSNNKPIHEITSQEDNTFISGETLGNAGRCLQFMGKIDEAMICFKLSIQKLTDLMNKGYGFQWYADCLVIQNQIDTALWFYRQAYLIWRNISPIKANSIEKVVTAILIVNPTLDYILKSSEKETERYCSNIINSK